MHVAAVASAAHHAAILAPPLVLGISNFPRINLPALRRPDKRLFQGAPHDAGRHQALSSFKPPACALAPDRRLGIRGNDQICQCGLLAVFQRLGIYPSQEFGEIEDQPMQPGDFPQQLSGLRAPVAQVKLS